MKIFIIPSWQPSDRFPTTGIFFYDQARVLAQQKPDWQIAISSWGSHDPRLWSTPLRPLDFFLKRLSKLPISRKEVLITANLVEFYNPCLTWTRRFLSGNLPKIVHANEENLLKFIAYYGKPDIIHAQVTFPAGYIAEELSKKFKIPFVITEHMTPFPMQGVKDVLKKRIMPALHAASKVMVVSQHLKEALKNHQIDAHLIPNFIDEKFFNLGESLIQGNQTILVAVGRLENQKNYPLLIRAVDKLRHQGVLVQLKIAGEGTERKKISTLIQRLGLQSKIQLLGDIDKDSLKLLLHSADRFVSASLHENMPVAILEALACGLPVITTPWQGADKMVNSDVSGIAQTFDPKDFSFAISKSIDKEYSKEEIRQFYLSHYGNEVVINELEGVYQSVILK